MQRAERRRAEREGRAVRTLTESSYLLGVTDESRLGALRFRWLGEEDEDLELIFAPGSSLGGARPKASIVDQHGHLSIAKFPKETDEYSLETWEEIALRLAARAGIATPHHQLIEVAGKVAMLSRRVVFEAASEYYALTLAQARSIIKDVATVTATWRDAAKSVGARPAEITRMASAFEHEDLAGALVL